MNCILILGLVVRIFYRRQSLTEAETELSARKRKKAKPCKKK
jgi:hypothetical protein